jgi:hypothetical protein
MKLVDLLKSAADAMDEASGSLVQQGAKLDDAMLDPEFRQPLADELIGLAIELREKAEMSWLNWEE